MTNFNVKSNLRYDPISSRNLIEKVFTFLSGVFAVVAILPLVLVISYVIFKGVHRLVGMP